MSTPAELPPDEILDETEDSAEEAHTSESTTALVDESPSELPLVTEEVEDEEDEIRIRHEFEPPAILTWVRSQLDSISVLGTDLFLGLLALTALNGIIFVYYALNVSEGVELKVANQTLREDLGKDADLFNAISEFVSVHGEFSSPTNKEFETALSRYRSKLTKFGIDSFDLFFFDEFLQKNGGLYWLKKTDRAPTVYQPITP